MEDKEFDIIRDICQTKEEVQYLKKNIPLIVVRVIPREFEVSSSKCEKAFADLHSLLDPTRERGGSSMRWTRLDGQNYRKLSTISEHHQSDKCGWVYFLPKDYSEKDFLAFLLKQPFSGFIDYELVLEDIDEVRRREFQDTLINQLFEEA